MDGVAKLLRDELLLDRGGHKHGTWLYGESAAATGADGRTGTAQPRGAGLAPN